MVTNFSSPIKGANGGSCSRLAGYLEKENNRLPPGQQEAFFSSQSDKVSQVEVVAGIDRNGAAQGLKTGQDRFYTFTIDPSQKELAHIGGDPDKLRDYTRAVMDNYAANFGKGIESRNLVWYAKIEYSRHYAHDDKAVQEGAAQKGQPKEGDQTHIHVIVRPFQRTPAGSRAHDVAFPPNQPPPGRGSHRQRVRPGKLHSGQRAHIRPEIQLQPGADRNV